MPLESSTLNFSNLDRPVIFFDLETTGLSHDADRIIELCAIKFYPDKMMEELHAFFNPTIPISAEATGVHGITNEMVADKPTFEENAVGLADFFQLSDLAGFNIRKFDIPMLMAEFHRHKKYPIDPSEIKIIDCYNLYVMKERRDLSAAVRFYCNEEHINAHSAKQDVLATINIFKRQLEMYEDIQPTVDFIHQYTGSNQVDLSGKFVRHESGDILLNFGKHKGEPAKNHLDYLGWMVESDFSYDTKMVAQKIISTQSDTEKV